MRKVKLASAFLIGMMIMACDSNETDECTEVRSASIVAVEGPDEGQVNEPQVFDVDFAVINGCGGFQEFKENTDGNTITIEVFAIYQGCVCTQDVPIREVDYSFTPSSQGTYTLKFKSGESTFIEKQLTIN